jgi:hypothetical protein
MLKSIARYLDIPRNRVTSKPSVSLEGGTVYEAHIYGGILTFTLPPNGTWELAKLHIDKNLSAAEDDICPTCVRKYSGVKRISCGPCAHIMCLLCVCDNLRANRGVLTCPACGALTRSQRTLWAPEETEDKIKAFIGRATR